LWERGECLKLDQCVVDCSWWKVSKASEQKQPADERCGEHEAMADGVRLERACEVLCATSETDQPEHQAGERNEE